MNKNTLLRRLVAGILTLAMIFGTFTVLNGAFSGVKAETVNPDGSITYGASNSAIVLNKDAWLEPDGTYAIDLTAYLTGEKQLNMEQFDVPTDFIVVVDQSCTMSDSYLTDCIDGYTYSVTTNTLTAAKSITRALVDALRADGADHRVGIIGFGGHSCDATPSNTGLFDNNGNWYNYRFSFGYQWPTAAQNKYGSTLTRVNTNAGYTALKKAIGGFTYNSGAYTDIGLEMAKGVINATKNDTYQVVNANGTVSNVARKKVVILLTDGTPGWDGFDMKIAAAAVNNATSIKKDFGAKIYTVAFNTITEELTNAWNNNGSYNFSADYGWNDDSAPVHANAYNPTYGTSDGVYTTTKYNTLKLQGEFFSRDFTTVLSSAYPCTANYGANGPVEGKYLTNSAAYSYVGQNSSGVLSYSFFPAYKINGYLANYVTRAKSIGYFYTEANGSHKLISGLYDNNVRNFTNRIPYNNHPVDRANDPEYGKYRISVPDARVLVNGSNSSPTQALSQLISRFIAEIPKGTNYSGSTEMNTIGEAYIKDIISEYFFYHDSFDPAVNVKTFTQDVIGYQNGEYVFAKNLVPYNGAIVDQNDDVVTVAGFDYDANVCYKDTTGVHGKKFIVQIRGLLAKDTTIGSVAISNTPDMLSGIYSAGSSNGSTGPVVVNNFEPITGIDLENMYLAVNNNSVSSKQPVLKVYPANSDYTASWSIGNTSVATVDAATGRVTPKSSKENHTTTLTVKVHDNVTGKDFTDTATIGVINMSNCTAISACTLGDQTVKVGSSKMINFNVSPLNTYYQVTWTGISDPSVINLDASGMVTGTSEGTSVLTAKIKDLASNTTFTKTVTVTVLPETTVIDGGNNSNNSGSTPNQLLVMGGDEVIFPVPYVNIREKSIVYDFSLKIQDDDATTFFENDARAHDVRHILTFDDAYAQQPQLANGDYGYHVTYPYDTVKHADLFENFEVGISDIDVNGEHKHSNNDCNAYVVIKSVHGDKYDVATILELTSTRRDIITGETKTVYEWCRVYFLPATNVHYEESLLSFTDAVGSANGIGTWVVNGQANGAAYDVTTGKMLEGTKYSDANQSTANNLYGHDEEYHNRYKGRIRDTHGDSNGRAMSVKVDNELRTLVDRKQAEWPKVEFTFRGNELDIMSRIGHDTGVLSVDIVPIDKEYNYAGATDSAHIIVDTYYSEGMFYQIPVLHYDKLDWGDYKVQIKAMYSRAFDHQTKGYVPTKGEEEFPGLEEGVEYQIISACTYGEGTPTRTYGTFNVYVDGIRVYNPHAEQVSDQKHEYFAANEQNPVYSQVRARLIDAGSFGGAADRVSGVVYIDGSNGNPVTIEDYERFGPNNEAYLTPGNGFAFTVKEFKKQTDRLHISAKSPNAKSVIMSINGVKYNIDSATELFFDVTDAVEADGRVVITCGDMGNTPDATLSVCQIKVVSDAQPTRGNDDSLYVDKALIDFANRIFATEQKGLSIQNVVETARYAMGITTDVRGFSAMDMDGDSKLTLGDATELLRILASFK